MTSVARPAAGAAASFPWMNTSLSADERARLLVRALTLDEKVGLMHGIGDETGTGFVGDHTGAVPPIPRVGFPGFHLTDGPGGVRQSTEQATAMPAPVALAAGFDPDLAQLYGSVVGREARDRNNDVLFGPMENMVRLERGGRDFETYGEDPYLAARIGVGYVEGVQAKGEIATAKHWVANNQEVDRTITDANVDVRTLHELYMQQFQAAVQEAHVGAVMAAYNRVNGSYNAENCPLLRDTLKGEFGFDGFVVSDYDSTHGSAGDVICGTDQEYPTGANYQSLPADVAAGRISVATIDAAVFRILRTLFRFGVIDRPTCSVNQCAPIDVHGDGLQTRTIAEAGTVLLKNDPVTLGSAMTPLLPLDASRVHSIALLGPSSQRVAKGGGSSQVAPEYEVTPLQGITARAAAVGVSVVSNPLDSPANPINTGAYPGQNPAEIAPAVTAAAQADVALVFVSDALTEGFDRPCLELSCGGNFDFQPIDDAYVAAVRAANPRTVVVLESGAPDVLPWAAQIPAIVEGWYQGEENGNAIAAVLFGDADPGGRLPVSFPQKDTDVAVTSPTQYPGIAEEAQYSEGLFTGYRHYDQTGIAPMFAFGAGMSYASFAYSALSVHTSSDAAVVSFDVTDTGARAGYAVPQLYVGAPADNSLMEPVKWLRGFTKLFLAPGATAHVSLTLRARDVSYYDVGGRSFRVQPGCHPVLVGASAADIRLRGVSIGAAPSSCTATVGSVQASTGTTSGPAAASVAGGLPNTATPDSGVVGWAAAALASVAVLTVGRRRRARRGQPRG